MKNVGNIYGIYDMSGGGKSNCNHSRIFSILSLSSELDSNRSSRTVIIF